MSIKKNITLFIVVFISFIFLSFLINKNIIENFNYLSLKPQINTIVLGNSQAECAVRPDKKSNFVNIASAADSYFYSYLKLKTIAENNTQIDTLRRAINKTSEGDNTLPLIISADAKAPYQSSTNQLRASSLIHTFFYIGIIVLASF